MRDAASRFPGLGQVLEAQVRSGQARLRDERRVGLYGDQFELQAGRPRRLALALRGNLEGTVNVRALDTVPRPLAPVFHVHIAVPDRVRICRRLGAVLE